MWIRLYLLKRAPTALVAKRAYYHHHHHHHPAGRVLPALNEDVPTPQ
jgi:hypothetical protein